MLNAYSITQYSDWKFQSKKVKLWTGNCLLPSSSLSPPTSYLVGYNGTEKRQNPACILITLSGLGFSIRVTLAIVKNEDPLMLSEFVFTSEVASHSIHRSLKTEKHILGDDRVKTFFGFQGYKINGQSLGCTNSKNSWCLMRSCLMHKHVWMCMGTGACAQGWCQICSLMALHFLTEAGSFYETGAHQSQLTQLATGIPCLSFCCAGITGDCSTCPAFIWAPGT